MEGSHFIAEMAAPPQQQDANGVSEYDTSQLFVRDRRIEEREHYYMEKINTVNEDNKLV